jgi:HAD superfamily hydrolase (TIGR01459 family)
MTKSETQSLTKPGIPIVSGIAGLTQGRRAWIVDIWGVMHNGARAFPGAVDACRRFRAQGGTVLLLSNAPRPFPDVVKHLRQLGVPDDAYDGGVTSGDVTRGLMAAAPGRAFLHIGPERDNGLFEGLDVRKVGAREADAVLCSGLWDDTRETPDDYVALFEPLLARGLPMICANPDIKVERGDTLLYCAGALAQRYGEMGGKVTYAGKPHRPAYDKAFAKVAELRGAAVPVAEMIAIGDGVETDIRGGCAAGLDTVMIASAVHLQQGLSTESLHTLFAPRDFAPIVAMPALAW